MRLSKDKKVWLPDHERWEAWSGNWEIRLYNKVKEYFKGDTCLDIGAHVGIWSRRLSEHFNTVHAFEPVPSHIECHKENCKDRSNVILHEIALSDNEESKEIYLPERNSGRSTLQGLKKFAKKIPIQTGILDQFDFDSIGFIKMDVEGHEIHALKGAKNLLTKHSPNILIEIFPKNLKNEENPKTLLESWGYTGIQVAANDYLFVK